MAKFEYNHFINRKTKIFNILPMKETVLMFSSVFMLLTLSNIITVVIPIPKAVFTYMAVIIIPGYIWLVIRLNKEKHPSYLESWISRKYLQPKSVRCFNNRFRYDFTSQREKVTKELKMNKLKNGRN